mmetsp:Transcript_38594/g.83849  ORF Transcript_38594/g.83849 Transcript_38594/m.83849 type:complete len:204 (+) Transcript_38594:1254-1865(+)
MQMCMALEWRRRRVRAMTAVPSQLDLLTAPGRIRPITKRGILSISQKRAPEQVQRRGIVEEVYFLRHKPRRTLTLAWERHQVITPTAKTISPGQGLSALRLRAGSILGLLLHRAVSAATTMVTILARRKQRLPKSLGILRRRPPPRRKDARQLLLLLQVVIQPLSPEGLTVKWPRRSRKLTVKLAVDTRRRPPSPRHSSEASP